MSVKINIVSGFLGAGKTTFINKILPVYTSREKVALVENEFGEIGIDGGLLAEHGIEIREIRSGCICCSLSANFAASLAQLITDYKPDRIIIEPTGVGLLSEVVKTCEETIRRSGVDARVHMKVSIIDVTDFELYDTFFKNYFRDQVTVSDLLVLSKTQLSDAETVRSASEALREGNPDAGIIAADWDLMDAADLAALIDRETSGHTTGHCPGGQDCHDHCREHHREHHHEHHEAHVHDDDLDAIEAYSTRTTRIFEKREFADLMDHLASVKGPGLLLRAKGLFYCGPEELVQFDYTRGALKFFPPQGANPEAGFVIIGKSVNPDSLSNLFEQTDT